MGDLTSSSTPQERRKHGRAVAVLESIVVTVLSGSIFYEYLHNVFLQSYVRNAIESNGPILQFALPVGVAAIGGSVFLQRRREARESQAAILREQILTSMRFGDAVVPQAETIPHHPMIFERPARDKNFVFKKTNMTGRLSRNRDAERLPPEEDQEP